MQQRGALARGQKNVLRFTGRELGSKAKEASSLATEEKIWPSKNRNVDYH